MHVPGYHGLGERIHLGVVYEPVVLLGAHLPVPVPAVVVCGLLLDHRDVDEPLWMALLDGLGDTLHGAVEHVGVIRYGHGLSIPVADAYLPCVHVPCEDRPRHGRHLASGLDELIPLAQQGYEPVLLVSVEVEHVTAGVVHGLLPPVEPLLIAIPSLEQDDVVQSHGVYGTYLYEGTARVPIGVCVRFGVERIGRWKRHLLTFREPARSSQPARRSSRTGCPRSWRPWWGTSPSRTLPNHSRGGPLRPWPSQPQ